MTDCRCGSCRLCTPGCLCEYVGDGWLRNAACPTHGDPADFVRGLAKLGRANAPARPQPIPAAGDVLRVPAAEGGTGAPAVERAATHESGPVPPAGERE